MQFSWLDRSAGFPAPEVRGRRWLNIGDRTELSLSELRGKVVLLDFWTFCCINCLHALDELRELERAFPYELVVIGIHCPKYPHEADFAALVDAVERYDVRHPVLDDAYMSTWDAYSVQAWPTFILIDPTGDVVARFAGEGNGKRLHSLIERLVAQERRKSDFRISSPPSAASSPRSTALRFPGKAILTRRGTFLVSDSSHHQIVELEAADLRTEKNRIGQGQRGLRDGVDCLFAEPQGLLELPSHVSSRVGYDVIIADASNHCLRGLSLRDGHVCTIAGTGKQLRRRVPVGGSALEMSSPWDLTWWNELVLVAMAGTHQLWAFDPIDQSTTVVAGTMAEGLRDGPAETSVLAQPSGVVADSGGLAWFVDSESSALRQLRPSQNGFVVRTAVGEGLFSFGFVDSGDSSTAMMQHTLGLAALSNGSVAVADTYNGAIRWYDPATKTVRTLAQGLREPSDIVVDGDDMVVVESAAHRLIRLPIPWFARLSESHDLWQGLWAQVSPGEVTLRVDATLPPGQRVDVQQASPVQLSVDAWPPPLLSSQIGPSNSFTQAVPLMRGTGALHVRITLNTCDEGETEHPACRRYEKEWTIPVLVADGAPKELVLHAQF